jgi:hypothetical protein
MAENSLNKSTSYVSLNRQYQKLKREWMNEATREDLVNMLVLVASGKELPEQLQNLIKVLTVCQISEQLVKMEKKTDGKIQKRNFPTRPSSVDSDDGISTR